MTSHSHISHIHSIVTFSPCILDVLIFLLFAAAVFTESDVRGPDSL